MDLTSQILGATEPMPSPTSFQTSPVGQKRTRWEAFELQDSPSLADSSYEPSTPKRLKIQFEQTEDQGVHQTAGYPTTPEQPQRQSSTNPRQVAMNRRKNYETILRKTPGAAKDTEIINFLDINALASKKLAITRFKQDEATHDIERTVLASGKQSATYTIQSTDGNKVWVLRQIISDDYKKEGKSPSTIVPPWALEALGRDAATPQAVQRKFIAHQLDQALGFNLLPRLEGFLIYRTSCGTVEVYVERATTLSDVLRQNTEQKKALLSSHPDILNRLTLLQIFDGLIGELDRHGGNILLQETEQGPVIWGVDTDQCLPENLATLNTKLGEGFTKCSKRPDYPEKLAQCYLCNWPVIVTTSIREWIDTNVTLERADVALSQDPYSAVCSDPQKAFILGQIQALRQYLGLDDAAPHAKLKVIEDTQWLSDASLEHWATQRTQHWAESTIVRNFSYLTDLLLPVITDTTPTVCSKL